MGLTMETTVKRAIVVDSTICKRTSRLLEEYKVVSVDFCAAFRKAVPPGLGPDTTPTEAVGIFCRWLEPFLKGAEVVILAIDRPSQIPERRFPLYDERHPLHNPEKAVPAGRVLHTDGKVYKVGEVPVDEDVAKTIRADYMPAPWVCVLGSSPGKRHLWTACIDAMARGFASRGTMGRQYVIMDHFGRVEYYPHCGKSFQVPATRYGEGDMSSVFAAQHVMDTYGLKPALVVTNDMDVAMTASLQMRDDDLHVALGSQYIARDTPMSEFAYSPELVQAKKANATKQWKHIDTAVEIVRTPKLIADYDVTRRMHYTMLILCAGKVDYSKGIRRFGWSEPTVVSFITKYGLDQIERDPWLDLSRSHDGVRTLEFSPQAFVRLLQRISHPEDPHGKSTRKLTKIHTDCILTFDREIHDMLFCLRYWVGFDGARERGGPALPEYEAHIFPPDIDTVSDLVAEFHDEPLETHVLPEKWPVSKQ